MFLMDDHEVKQYLEQKAKTGHIIIPLSFSDKAMGFTHELEHVYFPPGTSKNREFELLIAPRVGCIIVIPRTRATKSAVSLTAHKHGLKLKDPLTRYDELRERFSKTRTEADIRDFVFDMFNEVLAFLDKRYKCLEKVKSIGVLPCPLDLWVKLTREPAENQPQTTGVLIANHKITAEGAIAPSIGDYVILLNMYGLLSLPPHEFLQNLARTIAHEIFHAAGLTHGLEMVRRQLEFLEEWLGIVFPMETQQALFKEAEGEH